MDAQLAGKGLQRVDSGGDLVVGYQAGISQEKEFDSLGGGGWGGWGGPFGWGNGPRVTTSTIDIGKLTIGLFDPASKHSSGWAPHPRHSISARIRTRTIARSKKL